MATEYRRMQQLRGTLADWTANDRILLPGEIGLVFEGTGVRARAGTGVAFSLSPIIGEVDTTARADAAAATQSVVALSARVTAIESSQDVAALTQQVTALSTAVSGKQDALGVGSTKGESLIWDGTTWVSGNPRPNIVEVSGATHSPDAAAHYRTRSATPVTVTVPPFATEPFEIGDTITYEQAAAGAVTFNPGAGVTINVATTHTRVTNGQFAVVSLRNVALNEWTIFGNLVPIP